MLNFRNVVLFDAATCAVMGLALVLAAAPLASWTAMPVTLVYYAGAALLPIAALMAAVALGRVPFLAGAVLVIGGNILWVLGSVALMVGDWIEPNGFGYVFIGVQAAAVAVLAALELAALRRGPARAFA